MVSIVHQQQHSQLAVFSNLQSTLACVFAFGAYYFLSVGETQTRCLKHSGKISFLSNVLGLFFPREVTTSDFQQQRGIWLSWNSQTENQKSSGQLQLNLLLRVTEWVIGEVRFQVQIYQEGMDDSGFLEETQAVILLTEEDWGRKCQSCSSLYSNLVLSPADI